MRLIDADALKDSIGEDKFWNYGYAICMVNDAQTIDPVKHGKWVDEFYYSRCSECGASYEFDGDEEFEFCPRCGSKMDLDGDSE